VSRSIQRLTLAHGVLSLGWLRMRMSVDYSSVIADDVEVSPQMGVTQRGREL
jgi:hypothetical protein